MRMSLNKMSLDEQIEALIQDAPSADQTQAYVAAIAPALKSLAQQLNHLHYYIVQTLDQDWALTTLSQDTQAGEEKTVIYAFPSLQDVSQSPYPMHDPNLIALPVPVIHILFQMLAIDVVESTIFFETPGNLMVGTEIRRIQLQGLVEAEFLRQSLPQTSLPPDIA